MNKILVGLLVGAALGAVDGATAWFTPQVRPEILTIIFFSTIKGILAGVAAGWFARKVQSVPKGIAFGFVVGLILAFLVAMSPDPKTGEHYWWQIMLPGSVLGGVIGWATQRYGRPAGGARTTASSIAAFALMVFSLNVHGSSGDVPLVTIRLNDDGKVVESWSSPTEGSKVERFLSARGDAASSQ
ncbi:MAG TPA: hypothetical protein VEU30_07850 [Thermoanaerobaculia bacterium]|nr:hypothetical protein [Thermoanaerobaculia bacterium]